MITGGRGVSFLFLMFYIPLEVQALGILLPLLGVLELLAPSQWSDPMVSSSPMRVCHHKHYPLED